MGDTTLLQTGIQASGSLMGELAQNVAMNRNLKMQNKYNQRMADYTYQKDLDMWNRQNAYNSPEQQMIRLKAAGLNPNLVYGNGSVTGNTTTGSLPRYQAPSRSYDFRPYVPTNESIGNMIPMFADLTVKQAQADNIKAQTETRNLDNALKAFNLPLEKWYGPQMYANKNLKLGREADNMGFKTQLTQYQAQMAEEWARNMRDKVRLDLENMRLKNSGQAENNVYLKLRNDWGKLGVTPSDNVFMRIAAKLLNSLGFSNYTQMQKW